MFKDWSDTQTYGIPMITEHLVGDMISRNHIVNLTVDQFLNPPKDWERRWVSDKGEKNDWVHGSARTLSETRRRLIEGDPTPVLRKAYEKFIKEFSAVEIGEIESTRRRKRWNADDGEVDVDRAIGGQDFLSRKHKKKAISRIVHIGFQSMFSSYFSEETFAQAAAGAVALANILETAGYRVKVSSLFCHQWGAGWGGSPEIQVIKQINSKKYGSSFWLTAEVEIKAESMPLDENMLLVWGLSGAGRHYDFSWQTSLLGSESTAGMGMATDSDYTYENFPHIDLIITQRDHAAIATKVVQFIKKDIKWEE